MHKILTTALLLSAGTVLAIADDTNQYTTTTTTGTPNYGNYSAWTIVWGGSDTSTTLSGASAAIPDSVSLSSISVSTPSASNSFSSSTDVKLAVYTVSALNSGGTATVLDSLVGVSSNSTGSWSTSTTYTFSFDGITLTSGTRYAFVFVSSEATADSLATALSTSTYSGVYFRCNVYTSLTSSGDNLSRIYGSNLSTYYSGQAVDATYITTAAVPEPSSFGLLAGIGALAMVASRRRRSRRA